MGISIATEPCCWAVDGAPNPNLPPGSGCSTRSPRPITRASSSDPTLCAARPRPYVRGLERASRQRVLALSRGRGARRRPYRRGPSRRAVGGLVQSLPPRRWRRPARTTSSGSRRFAVPIARPESKACARWRPACAPPTPAACGSTIRDARRQIARRRRGFAWAGRQSRSKSTGKPVLKDTMAASASLCASTPSRMLASDGAPCVIMATNVSISAR